MVRWEPAATRQCLADARLGSPSHPAETGPAHAYYGGRWYRSLFGTSTQSFSRMQLR